MMERELGEKDVVGDIDGFSLFGLCRSWPLFHIPPTETKIPEGFLSLA